MQIADWILGLPEHKLDAKKQRGYICRDPHGPNKAPEVIARIEAAQGWTFNKGEENASAISQFPDQVRGAEQKGVCPLVFTIKKNPLETSGFPDFQNLAGGRPEAGRNTAPFIKKMK